MRIEAGFQPKPFLDQHPYRDDLVLPSLLGRILPATPASGMSLSRPATLTQYNVFGQRVDRLHTSEGWRELKDFAVREGYTAIAYERKCEEHSRTSPLARTMVMTGDCHVIMYAMGPTARVARPTSRPPISSAGTWFSGAAEGNVAVAVARTGGISQSTRSLSLFLVPLRMGPYPTPLWDGVFLHRLKNKIGTHVVPIAELELRGTRAWLLGP
ncbi:hypothetical protein K466DRAFT_570415 [Polyporus arcularius HHB13444]|uniref:Uncharacterized protein n=1 Tax=Polyporus arcularius HHB13444 TaxID=1314778 RepID=A0A5C3NQ32_9APHY|nr:hypothetical protein K466DRAFT_570415 [Polyporus arcularius HHB13444]